LRKNYRNIVFVYDVDDDPRKEGFLEAAQQHNLPPESARLCFVGKTQPIESLVEQILADPPRAIFAAYDKLAQRILRCLKQRQISVPEEIALISTGNESYADLLDPPLTSYELHHPELGALLMDTLIAQIDAPSSGIQETIYLDGYLAPRHSA
jgi:DNA-binding LacI/PurR family transcriptional regulator